MGGEFDHDSFDSENQNFPYGIPGDVEWTRRSTAVFGELRIPLIGPAPGSRAGDTLAVTAAGRYDHFDDFGGKTTPQFGLEWRPLDSLLVRGSYNRAFKGAEPAESVRPANAGAGARHRPQARQPAPVRQRHLWR